MLRRQALLLSLLTILILACSFVQAPTPTLPPTSTPEPPTATPEPATPTSELPTDTSPPPPPTSTIPPKPVRIQFEPGATSAALTGHLEAGGRRGHVLRASADQTMQVQATAAEAIQLKIEGADGTVLKGSSDSETAWQGRLPATQDYVITIISAGGTTDYDLRVTIFARLRFESDEIATTVTGYTERLNPAGAEFVGGYVLRALAGQMMDVAITSPNDDVLLSIVGGDGVPLKRYVDGEPDWRGELPATQDYYISPVSVGQETSYTLTIAVGPLGWKDYRDEAHGFEMWYPKDFTADMTCHPVAVRGDIALSLRLTGSDYYSGTNLLNACVIVGVNQGEEARSTCLETKGGLEENLDEEEINGIAFQVWSSQEGAAGNVFEEVSYRTIHGGACYEITLLLHAGNIGAYPEGTVTAFDRDAVLERLKQVLHTFRFLE